MAAPASFLSAAAFSHWVALSAAPSVFRHFCTKLFLAAPASFLSAAAFSHWLALALAEASLTHLPTKLVLAAPASFFTAAWASHSCCAPEVALWAPPIPMPMTVTHRLNTIRIRFICHTPIVLSIVVGPHSRGPNEALSPRCTIVPLPRDNKMPLPSRQPHHSPSLRPPGAFTSIVELAQKSSASLRLRQLLTGLRMRLEDMLAIRRLQHHPGPARWLMEHIGSCNPGAVA